MLGERGKPTAPDGSFVPRDVFLSKPPLIDALKEEGRVPALCTLGDPQVETSVLVLFAWLPSLQE